MEKINKCEETKIKIRNKKEKEKKEKKQGHQGLNP